jgi:purine nucleosidase
MRPILLDTDPGIDDALAIFLAHLDPLIDFRALSTVAGNIPLSKTTQNSADLLAFLEAKAITTLEGCVTPLQRPLETAEDTHGSDGLGNCNLPRASTNGFTPAGNWAEAVMAKREAWDVIALGPLTNLATWQAADPVGFRESFDLWIMGGAFKSHGNVTPLAEFNFWVDPEAARAVLASRARIRLFTLDLTRAIVFTPTMRELVRQLATPMGQVIHRMTRQYNDFHWVQERVLGCVINDPLVVGAYHHPEWFEWTDVYAEVLTEGTSRGQLVVDWGNCWKREPNVSLALQVKPEAFFRYFFETLFPGRESEWGQIFTPPQPLPVLRPHW